MRVSLNKKSPSLLNKLPYSLKAEIVSFVPNKQYLHLLTAVEPERLQHYLDDIKFLLNIFVRHKKHFQKVENQWVRLLGEKFDIIKKCDDSKKNKIKACIKLLKEIVGLPFYIMMILIHIEKNIYKDNDIKLEKLVKLNNSLYKDPTVIWLSKAASMKLLKKPKPEDLIFMNPLLVKAAIEGCSKLVEILLTSDADIKSLITHLDILLSELSKNGHVRMVRYLLKHTQPTPQEKQRAFQSAVKANQSKILAIWLEDKEVKINGYPDEIPPLFYAIRFQAVECFQSLHKNGAKRVYRIAGKIINQMIDEGLYHHFFRVSQDFLQWPGFSLEISAGEIVSHLIDQAEGHHPAVKLDLEKLKFIEQSLFQTKIAGPITSLAFGQVI